MTWNLWWRFGDAAPDRQHTIDRTILAASPDILALQEVYAGDDEDQFERIRSLTGLNGVASTVPGTGVRAEFGNALLSRFTLDDVDQIMLPGERGGPGHRSAILARIDTPTGRLEVAATHLEWRYGASRLRQQQLEVIVDALGRRTGNWSDAVPVILGDLNCTPSSDEFRRLTGESPGYRGGPRSGVFTDAWAAVGDGPGWTWTRDNPNAAEAAWPRRRVDHVLVGWPRPKPSFNPLRAELVGIEPDGSGVVGSDHYGVMVDLDERPPHSRDIQEVP